MNFQAKTEDSWQSCFDFVFTYTYFSFLPPFYNPLLLPIGCFIVFTVTFMLIRATLLLFVEGTYEFEYSLVTFKFTYLVAKAIIFITTRNTTQKTLKNTIDIFLMKNQYDVISGKDHHFLQLWNKMKPVFAVKWFYRTELFMAVLWIGQAFYNSLLEDETAKKSRFPFYCFYYNYNAVTKWAYLVADSGVLLSCVFQNIHSDIVLIAFFSFLECQVRYLRRLIREISEKKYFDHKDLKWWLENHQLVLRYSENLADTIKFIVLATFFFNAGQMVFCILTYSQENTNQGLLQKFLMLVFLLGESLVVGGYECRMVEKVNEIHFHLYESIYKVEYIFSDEKTRHFLKMLVLRTQKDIQFRGYSFFTMCFQDLKELVLTTYQVYASLSSIKK